MFFNENPARFFPQTQIDVVQFPEGPGADRFAEKIFAGPHHRMLADALNYMTEGRGTGIPKILRAIEANESPPPRFETDEERSFFIAEFPIHPRFREEAQVPPQVSQLLKVMDGEMDRNALQENLGLKDRFHFREAYLTPTLETGLTATDCASGGWGDSTRPGVSSTGCSGSIQRTTWGRGS